MDKNSFKHTTDINHCVQSKVYTLVYVHQSLNTSHLHQLYNTTQHNTTQHNTTQHNTTQHNTTQHNTTQHNTTQSTYFTWITQFSIKYTISEQHNIIQSTVWEMNQKPITSASLSDTKRAGTCNVGVIHQVSPPDGVPLLQSRHWHNHIIIAE